MVQPGLARPASRSSQRGFRRRLPLRCTSPDATSARYTISVNSGWQPKQVSANVNAVFTADHADYSSGGTAPVSLTVTFSPHGTSLANGTYFQTDSGLSDVFWRTYTETHSRSYCG